MGKEVHKQPIARKELQAIGLGLQYLQQIVKEGRFTN